MSKVNSTWVYKRQWYYGPLEVLNWRLKSLMYKALNPERSFYPKHSREARRDSLAPVPAEKAPAAFLGQKPLDGSIRQGYF